MFPAFLVGALILPSVSLATDSSSCEDMLPKSVDASICDDIQSAVFVFRFAIRDIDKEVKDTVLTALKEAQKILDSTMSTATDDVRGMFEGTRRKRRAIEDLRQESRTLAESAAKNIDVAVSLAEQKIRSSITQAVLNADIQNDKVKAGALSILHKVLSKRSIGIERRGIAYDVKKAQEAASVEVRNAMKEAITTSIHEYKKIMDFFGSRLKELFKRANFKGNVEQAEQDIEALAIKSSISFIQFSNSSTSVAIGKAIMSVEGLLTKFNEIAGKNEPNVLTMLKSLLEAAGKRVSEVVVETKQGANKEIRLMILEAAEKMLKDYETIEGILKKHGV